MPGCKGARDQEEGEEAREGRRESQKEGEGDRGVVAGSREGENDS